jgi:hypothetical protein
MSRAAKDAASAEKVIKGCESGHGYVWPCFERIRVMSLWIIFDLSGRSMKPQFFSVQYVKTEPKRRNK